MSYTLLLVLVTFYSINFIQNYTLLLVIVAFCIIYCDHFALIFINYLLQCVLGSQYFCRLSLECEQLNSGLKFIEVCNEFAFIDELFCRPSTGATHVEVYVGVGQKIEFYHFVFIRTAT